MDRDIISILGLFAMCSFASTLACHICCPSVSRWRKLSFHPAPLNRNKQTGTMRSLRLLAQLIGNGSIIVFIVTSVAFIVGCLIVAAQ